MFAWGYPSRQRLDSIRLGGGGLRLQADGDSRQLALTSQKYTLKSMILKDSPSGGLAGGHGHPGNWSSWRLEHNYCSWQAAVSGIRYFHCQVEG